MAFTSNVFIFLFLPISLIFFNICNFLELNNKILKKVNIKDWCLCLFSFLFYAWAFLDYVFIFLIYIFVIFCLGKYLFSHKNGKTVLCIIIIINLGILFYFKYFDYSIKIINKIFHHSIAFNKIIIPLGISYIIFTTISYLIDIYRGDDSPGSFLQTLKFFLFFPKIASGPIVKWKDFNEMEKIRVISIDSTISGINKIIIGFAKKILIADVFGEKVSSLLLSLNDKTLSTSCAWLLLFLYFFQIYFDFSGYSDVAIGLSKCFGYSIKENFNFPYLSKSITEFWRRWHISLGAWFKDYLYIPLGGNRKGLFRTLLNLGFVFFCTGIWHGAGISYLAWGMLNAFCVMAERFFKEKKIDFLPAWLKYIVTILIVMFGWSFFCIKGGSNTLLFIKTLFGFGGTNNWIPYSIRYFANNKIIFLLIISIFFSTVPGLQNFQEKLSYLKQNKVFIIILEITILILFIITLIYSSIGTFNPFIYFQY